MSFIRFEWAVIKKAGSVIRDQSPVVEKAFRVTTAEEGDVKSCF